jgi:hypothetical protein
LLPDERLHAPGDVAVLAERIRVLATGPAALAAASARDYEASRAFLPERVAATRARFLADLKTAAGRTS